MATIKLGPGIQGVGPYGEKLTDKASIGSATADLLSNVITVLTTIGSLAFVIYFTIGALKWIISGGDKSKAQEAQNQMVQALIGLIALISGYFVVGIVGGVLGINILSPFSTLFPDK